MGIISSIAKPYSMLIVQQIYKWSKEPAASQNKLLNQLIKKACHTSFGREHHFPSVKGYEDFKKAVPIRGYEQFKPYIEQIIQGEDNVLWQGKPLYFAKTSGTTSGTKYIPLTKESISYHMRSAVQSSMNYAYHSGNSSFYDGKMIFLSGSPELDKTGDIPTGRLSGIVHRHVPFWTKTNRLPSYKINCIDDWEEKLDAIVKESVNLDMRLISGIPPWIQMYFDRLIKKTGKKNIKEIFPNLSLLVHGGVNFTPYRAKLESSIGKPIDFLETYPASEGFIAFQDIPWQQQASDEKKGLLLLLNHGIFYEFVPASEIFDKAPTRLSINDVETGVNYALLLSTNAGLWGYNIGDTIKFVSKNPHRIVVTGRIKHFISAFGEHVIAEEVENALISEVKKEGIDIIEFTVAPQVNPTEGIPYHEWFIEFTQQPKDILSFAEKVDKALQKQNTYYSDLIQGKVLQTLKITSMQKDAFINYMNSKGKLGGQNKVPRLANDRNIAADLIRWKKN